MKEQYERIKFLVENLNKYTKAYDEGNPLISDEEWDNLYFELKNLEAETNLILSNSPTQSIPYDTVNSLLKIEHNHKMLSLDKTKSLDDVISFLGNNNFLIMCKMDGLTCSLTYKDGSLISAETRGNGLIGEDILHNALHLPSIPKSIPFKEEITIDGEIICTYNDFEKFSSDYKNPRNFAAGSIRLLEATECAKRNLTFVTWDVITEMYSNDGIEYRLNQKLDILGSIGFTVVPYEICNGVFTTKESLENSLENIKTLAVKNSFPIDGAVFKFNDCEYGRSLGETAHHFKNALAYKFYDEEYETELIDIEWTMGRTGVLTPVAVFNPVDIDGSVVERASLHNISVMKDTLGQPYDNQTVWVYKSNMIIPQISKSEKLTGQRDEGIKSIFSIPETCPICGAPTEIECEIETEILVCKNKDCAGQLINRLDHFCGKKGLDIKGLSKATLEKLIDWNWVQSYEDLFNLTEFQADWIKKPGFGTKSVEKILNAINEGTNCELHQFIAALGIPLIGTTASKELEKYFNTWEDFYNAIIDNFNFFELPNFGVEMHNSIISFNYDEANNIAKDYLAFKQREESNNEKVDLNGNTFVITGKLNQFKNRDELKNKIESMGGKVTGSISKNTTYLINNDIHSSSSKNVTAKSLGIPIMTEKEFIKKFFDF